MSSDFNPRSPRGERRFLLKSWLKMYCYFNPRSPRGERLCKPVLGYGEVNISIHALREESDGQNKWHYRWCRYISIHALREESDKSLDNPSIFVCRFQSTLSARRATKMGLRLITYYIEFQSTLSARRATKCTHCILWTIRNFNPRSPRGERPVINKPPHNFDINFNPRSPRGERHPKPPKAIKNQVFQSTLSARRATRCLLSYL